MSKLELRRRAQRTLDKLPQTDFEAVVEAVKESPQTPRPRGMEKVKTAGLWRIRQGDYRIIYAIDDNEQLVTVVRTGHRREMYRSLQQSGEKNDDGSHPWQSQHRRPGEGRHKAADTA